MATSDNQSLFDLAAMRAEAKNEDRPNPVMFELRTETFLALLEVVEAAHNAAILTYSAKATTRENDEFQRRAKRLRKAFERLGMEHA